MLSSNIAPRTIASQDPLASPLYLPRVHRLARALIEASQVKVGERFLVHYDAPRNSLVESVGKLAAAAGAKVSLFERDLDIRIPRLKGADRETIFRAFKEEKEARDSSDRTLFLRCPRDPEILSQLSPSERAIYSDGNAEARKVEFTKGTPYLIFMAPTEADARIDGMSFSDFFNLMYQASCQPWDLIHSAQEILTRKLDEGRELRFVVPSCSKENLSTDLRMSIEGMTFANSTIARNFPGSEVFSAPVLDSVEGTLFAPGWYMEAGQRIKDIYLCFKRGKIVECSAKENQAALESILSNGEGARYLGEVALGTNRGLTRRMVHPLLAEKTCGTFHVAIGHCYEITHYLGKPINLNNGNCEARTSLHWDITIPVTSGEVLLDGKVLQKNGRFIDERLEILSVPRPASLDSFCP